MPRLAQIHRLIAHQPFTMVEDEKNPSLLSWNVRDPPSMVLNLDGIPGRNLYPHELAFSATNPPVTKLRILCGMFTDSDHWRIEVHNPRGVTVRDVLKAIYDAFKQPYPLQEFSGICAKTQSRILEVYHARVRTTADARATWEAGIQRGDCLMKHSWFGGLSLPYMDGPEMENTCILSLRIEDSALTLSSPTGIGPSPFR
ncbi:hypothetical protein GYMLUDRAFT_64954 [Collybiopsis luxurians FD-317 M1]|uniref:DUF6699 domain-containing protein n=1 Tax=Collybiopsis luxurians FD-317 M1 TaxID=944289 RepID=A0A0D0BNS0_9AGAR|nr:hypothetical protein GYMLUDRAFT_64954 [Collybiopsis luxurians FD-317 M1]